MSETVILPPAGTVRRSRRRTFILPLLVIPWIIYNAIALTLYAWKPDGWYNPLFQIRMVLGQEWTLTSGDLLLVLGLVCLFGEVLKSTNTGRSSILEHMLSTLLFVVFLVEFLLWGGAASSTFFLLMIMSLVDVTAGFTISITGAGRDVTME